MENNFGISSLQSQIGLRSKALGTGVRPSQLRGGRFEPARRASLRTSDGVRIAGKFLDVGGKRFLIKGVTYGTFSANDEGEPYPSHGQMKLELTR